MGEKRHEIEKNLKKGNNDNWNLKNRKEEKPLKRSGYPWNQLAIRVNGHQAVERYYRSEFRNAAHL